MTPLFIVPMMGLGILKPSKHRLPTKKVVPFKLLSAMKALVFLTFNTTFWRDFWGEVYPSPLVANEGLDWNFVGPLDRKIMKV